jgi:hypothetical protein
VGLIDWGIGSVPTGGFEWVEGQWGPHGTKECFLIPKPTARTVREIPADLYLKFAKLRPIPEATLEFANRHGTLGLPKRHFHSKYTKVQFAESLGDWTNEIGQFNTCLEAWHIATDADRRKLQRFMDEYRWRIRVASDGPFLTAKCNIIGQINSKLNPDRVLPEACFMKACKGDIVPVRLTPFVTYQLNFANRSANHTLPNATIEARMIPTELLSAIWLQFADLVTGSRVVRKCEKCHQWMDITESPHKGAKRMHERCSLALRMSRYRQRKRMGLAAMRGLR